MSEYGSFEIKERTAVLKKEGQVFSGESLTDVFDRKSLANRIENMKKDGRDYSLEARALTALDSSVQETPQTYSSIGKFILTP